MTSNNPGMSLLQKTSSGGFPPPPAARVLDGSPLSNLHHQQGLLINEQKMIDYDELEAQGKVLAEKSGSEKEKTKWHGEAVRLLQQLSKQEASIKVATDIYKTIDLMKKVKCCNSKLENVRESSVQGVKQAEEGQVLMQGALILLKAALIADMSSN